LARLRWRQGKTAEAVDHLSRAFAAYRLDPWPNMPLMSRALELVQEVGKRDLAQGLSLYALLAEPFAVRLLDLERRETRLDLAQAIDLERLCREGFAPFEPWPIWRADRLAQRAVCYEKTGDPRAARAEDDLAVFTERAPTPFAAALPPPSASTPAPAP
jgi:hypothetical protein